MIQLTPIGAAETKLPDSCWDNSQLVRRTATDPYVALHLFVEFGY